MIKRALCVIMCCVIAAALSLSVFADDLPRNDLAGNVVLSSITIYYESGTNRLTNINDTFSFGSFNYLDFYFNAGSPGSPEDLEEIYMYFNFDININNTSTIYIAISPLSSDFSLSLSSLSKYSDSSGDIEVSFPSGSFSVYDYDISASSSTSSSISPYVTDSNFSQNVSFNCYKNVPAGTYNLTFSIDDIYSNFLYPCIIPIGVYVSVPSIFENFENGNVTFNDAMNTIQNNLDSVINSNASDTEKLVAIGVAENDMERIKQISDVKYNGVVNDFISDADSIIDSYNNGSIDVNTAISDIQMTYFDALSQSVTPEQGVYINTANQIKLAELQLNWQSNYKEELDSVITDEDLEVNSEKLSHLDELHNQEMEVLSHFELAEFESQLEFSLWTDTLPSDYSNYKTIFEYFLEDNKAYQISQFLIVPFSLVLVSVLLATTTVVLRRNRNG